MLGMAFSDDQSPQRAPKPENHAKAEGQAKAKCRCHRNITILFTNSQDHHQNKRSLMCQEEGPEALAPEHEA